MFRTGGEDDRIDLVQQAVGRPHALRLDAADAVRHQRDVRPGERRVEVVADQDALAADRVIRPQLFAQRRVGYLRLQVRPRDRCELLGRLGSLLHGLVPGFMLAIERFATGEQTASQTAAQSSAPNFAPDPAVAPPSDPAISSSPAASVGSGAALVSGTVPVLDLKLEAAKATDVKVVADGKPLFEGHMDARQVYRFTAVDSLEISSSESSAILLELNGQAVAAGGQPGQPRFVTLTPKDLKPAAGDPH